MKLLTTLLCFILVSTSIYPQANNYNCCIKNVVLSTPTKMEFDVWIEWTGTNTQKLTFFQAGINFDYAGISNGGVITGALKPGSVDPSLPFQQNPNWNINSTSKQIRMLAVPAPNQSLATSIPAPPGFRLGTFVMSNTVPFNTSVSPNFTWSFVTGSGTTTLTAVAVYVNGATTGTNITIPANHCVDYASNTCPTSNAGGPYSSCGDVQLNGIITNATTATWTTSGSGSFDPDANTLNAIYHPSATDLSNGSVTLTLTTNAGASGCNPATGNATATFISIDDNISCTIDGCDQSTGHPTHSPLNCCPQANSGGPYVSCGDVHLNGSISFAASGTWSSSGTGTFDPDNTTLNATYHPSAADLSNGSVTLTLTTSGGEPGCNSATSGTTATFISTDDNIVCTIDGCNQTTGQPTHDGTNCDQTINYDCVIKNVVQTGSNTMEFDVWIQWTGGAVPKFALLQAGINFNYNGMANGGIITGAYKPGSAHPSILTSPAYNWNINQSSKQIRLIAPVSPESTAPYFSGPPGFRVGTFVMTNTVPFATLSQPNFIWSFLTGTGSTTRTLVLAYLNNSIQTTDITIPPNHAVVTGVILNPPCPASNAGGPYTTCGDVHLNGSFSFATSAAWTSSGSGTFDPDHNTLNATYHPSAADLSNGSVTLTLTTDAGAAFCTPASGSVTVNFTPIDDGDGCTADACDQLTGNPVHTNTNLEVSASAGTIACYSGTTCVTVTASGGVTPYSGTGELCGYGAGTYTFDVTDANGCTVTSDPVTLTEPDKIILSGSSTLSNGSDGTATVNASGGTPGYSYQWTPGNQSNATATGLAPGTYCVIVTDANVCSASYCVVVGSACEIGTVGPLTGPDGACKKQQGIVFCATPNAFATSYIWTLPTGVIAQGSTSGPCITLKFSSKFKGGFICAKAMTPCGMTPVACKNIVLINSKPSTPGVISGPASLCPNEIGTYSIAPVPTASGYEWKEDHLIILSGQGTTTVTVQAQPGFNGGKIKVRARNCKERSGERTRNISKSAGCRLPADDESMSNASGAIMNNSLKVFPNPASGIATITFISNVKAKHLLQISDMTGRVIWKEAHPINEGFNTTDVNLENLTKGIYLVSLISEDGIIISLPVIVE